MNTTLNQNRSFNLFLIAGFAITVIALLTLAVAQSIVVLQPAAIPVTGSQNAYLEYLRGEKMIYANPVALNKAITAYHLGEKPFGDVSNALSIYRAGDKASYTVNDVGAALTAYHLGEKMIVSFEAREFAMLTWRQGEKEAK